MATNFPSIARVLPPACLPRLTFATMSLGRRATCHWPEQVQIRRTQYGVPHITGESLEAAAFGFGYCQAEDHLLNIMRGILGTRGTLAETFGPARNNKNIEADFFNRQFRVYCPRGRVVPHARSRLSRHARRLCGGPELLRRPASRPVAQVDSHGHRATTWPPMAWRA